MALQVRTTISGKHKFIDLYDDEPVLMSLSFAELSDITQKNSAFSQAFKLPGSKNNNEIFNYFYNLNSTPLDFDPNNKFETILMWDGYEILQGNIRLDGVTIDKEEVIYQVTFYNQVGDLAANIGDKFLRNLDLSDLSHPYNEDVINYSQVDPNLFPLTGTTNYSYQNGKTFWGLYNIGYEYLSANTVNVTASPLVQFTPITASTYNPQYGFFDFTGTPVNDYYFKPSIQVKELYTQICNEAGYGIKSDFFDTSYFQKYYLPLKFLDETIYDRNAKQVCFSYTNDLIGLTGGTTAYTNPSLVQICNNYNLTSTSQYFEIPSLFNGSYTIKINYTLTASGATQCGVNAVNQSCSSDFIFDYVDINGNPQTYTIPAIDCFLSFFIPGACCVNNIIGVGSVSEASDGVGILGFWDGVSTPTYFNSNSVCEGQSQNVEFVNTFPITGTSKLYFFFTGQNAVVQNLKLEITKSPRFLISGDTIDYALEFPDNDYKQIDFITSINRYFNLVVVPDPETPRQLIVEPIVDYIGKGEILNWTTKIDHLQPVSVKPTTSLINGTLEYSFQLDQDYANQNFKSASNRIFGSEKKKLNLEYKDDTTKFDYMFSSPMDITILAAQQQQLTLSSFSKVNQKDEGGKSIQSFVPFKILPRLVFRGLTLPQDNYGFVGNTGTTTTYQNWYSKAIGVTYTQNRFQEINRFTTYPFNFNGFSHYCNWRGEDVTGIQPPEYQFVAEDLYDIYYRDYINDLISPESKIYNAKIYLYPTEIKQLRFDEKILVDNNYYRINKISNYNLLEPSICDIELVKLTKDYNPHRTLYYILEPCDGGQTLYSNSDLNYNLYAYNNNYVKLYNDNLSYLGDYAVMITDYDSTHDYKHYYISTGYTDILVGVYPDCETTGRTPFNIVQETEGRNRVYNYKATGCSDSITYYFSSNTVNIPQNSVIYITDNGSLTTARCVSGIRRTPTAPTKSHYTGYTFNNCSECNATFITPTPTITPTNTPTVTPTPNPTPTPTATRPIYYKLDNCSGGAQGYTSITPGVANQRYYDFLNAVYYVWDNTTTLTPGAIPNVAIVSGQAGCP